MVEPGPPVQAARPSYLLAPEARAGLQRRQLPRAVPPGRSLCPAAEALFPLGTDRPEGFLLSGPVDPAQLPGCRPERRRNVSSDAAAPEPGTGPLRANRFAR